MKTKKIVLIVLVLAITVVAGLVYYNSNKQVILAPELNIQPAPHESIKDIL